MYKNVPEIFIKLFPVRSNFFYIHRARALRPFLFVLYFNKSQVSTIMREHFTCPFNPLKRLVCRDTKEISYRRK